MAKEYSNRDITVTWDHAKCIHAAKCVAGSPNVFRPNEKPWVAVDKGSADEIMATVDQCPSGALSYRKSGEPVRATAESVNCNVSKNGPLLVKGDITVVHADGTEEQRSKTTAFCRCGRSGNQPFCNGTHGKVGFKG